MRSAGSQIWINVASTFISAIMLCIFLNIFQMFPPLRVYIENGFVPIHIHNSSLDVNGHIPVHIDNHSLNVTSTVETRHGYPIHVEASSNYPGFDVIIKNQSY